MGTIIADNVLITHHECCVDFEDCDIIDSSGGTQGAIGTSSVNTGGSGGGWNTAYHSKKIGGNCKNGQNKSGKCKKKGRRRRESDDFEEICLIKSTFSIVEKFKGRESIQDNFTSLDFNYYQIHLC